MKKFHFKTFIHNGNWTEWSAIWAWVRFEITSTISDQNCTTRGSITTFNYIHFQIAQIQDLVRSNILLMQYYAGLKLNSSIFFFWGGGGGGKNFLSKSFKICHMILFVSHFPAIWVVTFKKSWNLIGCFVFNVASSLAGKRMRFKAKKWPDSWINRIN